MRVSFLTEYFTPYEVGGAERSAERLAIELAHRGIGVAVATPNYGSIPREQRYGIEIIRFPFPQRLQPGQLARRRWLSSPAVHTIVGVRLARIMRQQKSHLLHVQNSGLVIAGVLGAALAGIPVVVTIRDLAYLASERRLPHASGTILQNVKWALDSRWSSVERRLKRRALSSAAEIVFVSRGLLDVYARGGLSELTATAHVIYNIGPPAPAATREPVRDPRLVLFVGKLSEGKGLSVLYGAAERVKQVLPDVRFVLAGSPGVGFSPPPEDVRSMFSLAGRVDPEAVQELMRRASVLAAPSVWPEPLSRVLLEAMSSRLPIVATAVGGTPEAVEHGSSAWLVPPHDADALADGIVRILSDPTTARGLADAASRRFAQRFSPDAIVPQILAVYKRACAGN